MICKYAGPCRLCTKTINRGEDCKYDPSSKTIQHWSCLQEPETAKPTEDQLALAERLHFVGWDAITSVKWSELHSDRAMQLLSGANRDAAPRPKRGDDETFEEQPPLFDVPY